MRSLVPGSAIALLALVPSACQPVAPSAVPPHQLMVAANPSLLGTWELVSVDGIAVPAKRVSVTFQRDARFNAMVDCNRARGFYSLSGAQLSFNGWEISEMGCLPPLPQEALIGEALRGDGYLVALTGSSELHLSGRHRLVFRRP